MIMAPFRIREPFMIPQWRAWFSRQWFQAVHQHHLVYNTCWEDPRLDQQALQLRPQDRVLVITSAGCNALDYALAGPARIDAVDMNPRQNALLELKIAGIRRLDHGTFFELFGRGGMRDFRSIYHDALRPELTTKTRRFWDRHASFFAKKGVGRSFYFHGTAGRFAYGVNLYINHVVRLRPVIEAILHASNLQEQQSLYERYLRTGFWTRLLRWLLNRNTTLALLGIPQAQRHELEQSHGQGMVEFINHCVEAVFARLPLADNYFWRVYLTGSYTPDCCPEYLKPTAFARLKAGLVDSIHLHHASILEFLLHNRGRFSRFVLLDHMDWLHQSHRSLLTAEWQTMIEHAYPGSRFLWRSGGKRPDFINHLTVQRQRKPHRLGELLHYHRDLADRLHAVDRVHTYGSFAIADLAV